MSRPIHATGCQRFGGSPTRRSSATASASSVIDGRIGSSQLVDERDPDQQRPARERFGERDGAEVIDEPAGGAGAGVAAGAVAGSGTMARAGGAAGSSGDGAGTGGGAGEATGATGSDLGAAGAAAREAPAIRAAGRADRAGDE